MTEQPKTKLAGDAVVEGDHREIDPATGMQKGYLVLSDEERAKGFVRPVRRNYIHTGTNPTMVGPVLVKPDKDGCGTLTKQSLDIAETYAHLQGTLPAGAVSLGRRNGARLMTDTNEDTKPRKPPTNWLDRPIERSRGPKQPRRRVNNRYASNARAPAPGQTKPTGDEPRNRASKPR
jgi:hypothetical protein